MEDIFKPRGALKASKPDAGGAAPKTVPLLGIVKDNIDPTRSGRIRVYIAEIGGLDPNNETNWTPVAFMAPYYGWVQPTSGKSGDGTFAQNPASYGMWFSPPDIGTTVVCLFINGDLNLGFYIGSIPTPEALRMVPAIGGNFSKESVVLNSNEANSYGGAKILPVTNMNTNNSSNVDSSSFLTTPKPVHSYVAGIMFQQGILRDPIRGPITSSAQREAPSRVGWGVSTPGRPIYDGGLNDETIAPALKEGNAQQLKVISRRGGHSIVMDDGDVIGNDQLIRIRTALGHQILMSDNGQTLMILHSNGQSYIELGKEGTIDLYSTNSVNVRTQGDLNLHADNNININATKNLNIRAESINIESEKDFNQKVGTDNNVYSMGSYKHKIGTTLSMESAGDASIASSSVAYVNGSRINLNTGSTSAKPKTVPSIPVVAHTDTLFDAQKGFAAAPGKLLSITSRAPAHAPWANACQGVDVKVSLSASAQLPSPPNSTVAAVNELASTAPVTASASVATTATVPDLQSASKALTPNMTAATISAQAVSAAVGKTSDAVKQGAGIINTDGKLQAVVGQLAMTPKQLDGIVLKPGASVVVDKLVQAGADLNKALPSNLFIGAPGAQNLDEFVKNTKAQVNVAVSTLQKAQTALTMTGLITGKEDGSQIAGLVRSVSTEGISNTIDVVKNQIASTTSGVLNNVISGPANAVAQAIKTGNQAANLAQTAMGGLGAAAGAVNALQENAAGISAQLDSARGLAASAFSAVTASFAPFKANIPQNLEEIAKEAEKKMNALENTLPNGLVANVGTTLSNISSQVQTATATLSTIGQTPLSVATAASGLNGLPGGARSVSNILDTSTQALNAIPSISDVKTLADNVSSAVNNGISVQTSIQASAGSLLSGATSGLSNIANSVTSATDALGKLNSGAGSLASFVRDKLPVGELTKLNASLSALTSGGPLEIKIPTVSIDTTDRSELTGAISSVFGNPKIPIPNFSGSSASEANKATIKDLAKVETDWVKKTDTLIAETDQAKAKYYELKNKLPKGDPAIDAARNAWFSLVDQLNALAKKTSLF